MKAWDTLIETLKRAKKTLLLSITLMFSVFYSLKAQVPSISSFSPTSGIIGSTVTITGTNFSSTAASNIVYFGAAKASVGTASATQLTVQVPTGATYDPITVISNGLIAFSAQPFTVTLANAGVLNSVAFMTKADFSTATQPVGLAAGDLDLDGKVDLVTAGRGSNKISILKNTGTSGSISFQSKVDFSTGSSPFAVALGDVDNDGKLDIAVTDDISSGSVYIFKNVSTQGSITGGSFTLNNTLSTGSQPIGVAIRDLDGDGKSEVIVANSNSNTLGVFQNTTSGGTISFGTQVTFSVGQQPNNIAIGDLDGDGKPEIVSANFITSNVSVLKNTTVLNTINAGSFAPATNYTTGGAAAVALADIDNDGKLDILAANTNGNSVSLLRNVTVGAVIAAGSFSNKVDLTAGTNPNAICLGDLNGDGKPDIIITSVAPEVSVYANAITNSGAFTAASFASKLDLTIGNSPYGTVIADFDGDGRNDIAATSQTGNVISVFKNVIDYSPPFVSSNTTSPSTLPNTDVSVSANIVDDISGISTAKIQYRPVAGAAPNNFFTFDLIHGSGSTYTYTIPAAAVTELGVEYKFLLTDIAGNSNQAAQTYYNVVINHSADNSNQGLEFTSYTSANGENQTNYRIISIPLELNNKTADDVFKDVIGSNDPTVWRMFHYNGTTNAELSGTSVVVPGEGYWFIATPSSPLYTGGGTTVNVNSNSPFTITLRPGWNQIGNPYNFNISWSDVLAANPSLVTFLGVTSKIRTYRGSDQDQDKDIVRVTEGGFVKNTNTSAITIKIPVTKNAGAQGGRQSTVSSTLTNSLDQTDWEVLFNLKSGATEYKFGGFGMRHDAQTGFDYYDDYNLPRFLEYLEIKYPKERVGMTYTKDIVPTKENFAWEFTVESNLEEAITSLQWDNSYFGSGKEIFLLDVASHRITDMNIQNHYDFSTTRSRAFKVVFGNPEFVKSELVPENIVLFDPYPNPFTDRVFFEYTLPKEAIETGGQIEIYNSAGIRIASGQTNHDSGNGKWSWESENQMAGLYFIKLQVGNRSATRKIIKR